MHRAAACGDAPAVLNLLARNANVHAFDVDRLLPVHHAARNGHAKVVAMLLQHKVNVDALGGRFFCNRQEGYPPLAWAAEYGCGSVVDVLIANRADLNARDEAGNTALSWATELGHTDVVKMLLDHQADANAHRQAAFPPLHRAATYGFIGITALLLERKADVNRRSNLRDTALHIAAKKGWATIVALLLQHDADVTALSRLGQTPFHLAIQGIAKFPDEHEQTVWTLIYETKSRARAKEALRQIDREGKTPVDVAIHTSNAHLVAELLTLGESIPSSDRLPPEAKDVLRRAQGMLNRADFFRVFRTITSRNSLSAPEDIQNLIMSFVMMDGDKHDAADTRDC